MAEAQTGQPRSSRGSIFTVIWIVCLVLVLYVLSIGPAVLISQGKHVPALAAFYRPLLYLSDRIPAIGQALNWYLGLWGISD